MNEPLVENHIIYLIGPPGVGKLTVARLLAEQLPAILVSNHHWLNPILRVIPQDGVTPLPDAFWHLAARSRRTIFDAIVAHAPPAWSYIVTHAAMGAGDEKDVEITADIKRLATARDATLRAFQLTAGADALAGRMVTPERRALMKHTDPTYAARHAAEPPYDPGVPGAVHLDTADLTADATAQAILAHIHSAMAP